MSRKILVHPMFTIGEILKEVEFSVASHVVGNAMNSLEQEEDKYSFMAESFYDIFSDALTESIKSE